MNRVLSRIRKFIAKQSWIFAKTFAATSPHEYVVKGKLSASDQKLFEEFVVFIREHGSPKKFKKSSYVHFDLDGWSYWTMGAPLGITIIINRHRLGFYDAISDRYDGLFTSDEPQIENAQIRAALAASVKGKVLDIGCGTGLLLDLFPDQNFEYLGIDPSEKMLARLQEKHPEAQAVATTFEDFTPAGKYDLVTGLFGSPSYINPASFAKIRKILKKKGKFFLMFYAPGYFPLTYQKTGICFSHYATRVQQLADAFGETFKYSHYLIATNIPKK